MQALYNWQTIVGALLALSAAILGAILLWKQIHTSEKQEAERLRRRFRAARATLALSLSALIEYIITAGKALGSIHAVAGQAGIQGNQLGFQSPRLPSELVPALDRMVEVADTDDLGDKVHDILSDLQTFQARIRELENLPPHRVGVQLNVEEHILQAARLHRNVSELFPVARADGDDQGQASLMGALRFAFDLDEIQFARVYRKANELDAARQ